MPHLSHTRLIFSGLLAGSLAATTRLAIAAPAPQGGSVATPSTPTRVSGGVMAGLLLEHPNPEYPAEAREKHISGAVVLSALVSEEGRVETLISGPPELRKAALAAVKQWTYKPYQLNGQPVPVQTVVTVNLQPQP